MSKKKIQVILLEDVVNIGKKYEVHDVAMGYFRNLLLPNELAEPATEAVLESLNEERKKAEEAKQVRLASAKENIKKIEGTILTFKVSAGTNDKLYGSVSNEDIEERLKEKGFTDLSVKLDSPIKEIGGKEVTIDLGEGVATRINVNVIAKEKGDSKKESPKEEKSKEVEN